MMRMILCDIWTGTPVLFFHGHGQKRRKTRSSPFPFISFVKMHQDDRGKLNLDILFFPGSKDLGC